MMSRLLIAGTNRVFGVIDYRLTASSVCMLSFQIEIHSGHIYGSEVYHSFCRRVCLPNVVAAKFCKQKLEFLAGSANIVSRYYLL